MCARGVGHPSILVENLKVRSTGRSNLDHIFRRVVLVSSKHVIES